ncbi:MAG: helix-turn-helix domain-containing protein [Akkermansiaceae bacterium]
MNATKPLPASFAKLPKTYEALCRIHMPRTLHDEIELEAVTEIIDLMAGHTLNRDQADYLETLSELAEAYESANHDPLPALPPHEFLSAHLENIGMSAAEWGKLIGIDRSTASRLLRGERKFNTTHVRKTAEALGIEPSLLI